MKKGDKVLLLEVAEFQTIFTKESITNSKDVASLFNN